MSLQYGFLPQSREARLKLYPDFFIFWTCDFWISVTEGGRQEHPEMLGGFLNAILDLTFNQDPTLSTYNPMIHIDFFEALRSFWFPHHLSILMECNFFCELLEYEQFFDFHCTRKLPLPIIRTLLEESMKGNKRVQFMNEIAFHCKIDTWNLLINYPPVSEIIKPRNFPSQTWFTFFAVLGWPIDRFFEYALHRTSGRSGGNVYDVASLLYHGGMNPFKRLTYGKNVKVLPIELAIAGRKMGVRAVLKDAMFKIEKKTRNNASKVYITLGIIFARNSVPSYMIRYCSDFYDESPMNPVLYERLYPRDLTLQLITENGRKFSVLGKRSLDC